MKHTLTIRLFATGSRYIYDLYYEKEAISKPLYDWLLKNGYADANLIAKWKKPGYEKVRRSRASMYKSPADGGWNTVVLSAMYSDERDQLQQHVHLPRAARATQGRPGDTVCELWV